MNHADKVPYPRRFAAGMLFLDDSEICRHILETLPTALCVVDMSKKIVLWSDGAERVTGHSRHEVIGNRCVSKPVSRCGKAGRKFCCEESRGTIAGPTTHSTS